MLSQINKRRRAGFTLVELMIVVAIIAVLAAIAVPNFLRARKRSQATRILEDLRVLDSALDQYAIDTGRTPGFSPNYGDLVVYLKTGTTLYYNGGTDLFGDTYGPFTVDSMPTVPANAYNSLSDVIGRVVLVAIPSGELNEASGELNEASRQLSASQIIMRPRADVARPSRLRSKNKSSRSGLHYVSTGSRAQKKVQA